MLHIFSLYIYLFWSFLLLLLLSSRCALEVTEIEFYTEIRLYVQQEFYTEIRLYVQQNTLLSTERPVTNI